MSYPYYNTTDNTVFLRDISHCSVLLFNCATLLCTIGLIVKNRRTVFSDQIYTIWLSYLFTRLTGNILALDPIVKHLPYAIASYLIEQSYICSHILGMLAMTFVRIPTAPLQLGIALYIVTVVQFPLYFYKAKGSTSHKRRVHIFLAIVFVFALLIGCSGVTHFRIIECINDRIELVDEPLLSWPSPRSLYIAIALQHFSLGLLTAIVYLYFTVCSSCCSCSPNRDLISAEAIRSSRKIQRRLGVIGLTSFVVSFMIDFIKLFASKQFPLLFVRFLVFVDYGIDPFLMFLKNTDFRRICLKALGFHERAAAMSQTTGISQSQQQ